MTAALHVSFNLLILYHICDMAKKNLDFRNYFYVKDSIIDFTTSIGGQLLYKISTLWWLYVLVNHEQNRINFVDSPWQQALSTFQSFARNDRRVEFWTFDIPKVLTLQEGASGMDIKKGGGLLEAAPVKTCLGTILTRFFGMRRVGE